MIFDEEFKKALRLLPTDEKDKLILRMLKQNTDLANKLYFQLVDLETVEEKREKLQNKLIKSIQLATDRYYSAGYLLMDMRAMSGEISNHIAITKDKEGEISLQCLLLIQTLTLNNERIANEAPRGCHTLCVYIIAKIFKILMLIQKQHEDLHIEYQDDIEKIGNLLGENKNLMKSAINNGLDVNWLIKFSIPANIAGIYKTIREQGFLR